MPSIFLSHTYVDKPFVEKLAKDLTRLGVNVWYDKWEIKVGDSITWKVEEGIRENEFLGIIFSPEALNSEWVKSEISSAWVKQMQTKKVVLLPIYYRDCQIPYFLADRRFADFRQDYQTGLCDLVSVFGMKGTETISLENWRKFVRVKNSNWKDFRDIEFENLVTVLVNRALEYNWSSWVGGTRNPYSITLHAWLNQQENQSITLKLCGKTFAYKANLDYVWNPNHLKSSDFNIYIGNSVNECEEYVWRVMEDFKRKYGRPITKQYQHTTKILGFDKKFEVAKSMIKQLNWYKGDML